MQYLVSEEIAEDFSPFTKASHEVNLGWKWEMPGACTFELGLIENVITYGNSPDFGVHMGLKHRF